MENNSTAVIKIPGFALSGFFLYYLYIMYCIVQIIFAILLIILTRLIPTLNEIEWLVLVPLFCITATIPMYIICCFYTVTLTPDTVILKWFSIETRRISVSEFKTFCAVGNEREDVLCLSCYCVEDMALLQEKRLLHSFLNKHSVPFRKAKADWKNDFAGEFLNYLQTNPFALFREHEVIMFRMHPSVQCAIRQMYPQLPYKNYTTVKSSFVPRFSSFKEDLAVNFSSLREFKVRTEHDGIHIYTKQEEISFIPAQEIKTVLRVDIFKEYDKYHPHHLPLLFTTCMTEKELSAHNSSKGYGGIRLPDSADQSLLAMTAATYLTLHWNQKRKDCCVMYYTEKNLNTLLTLYPHIRFNETAASWLNHSVESQS